MSTATVPEKFKPLGQADVVSAETPLPDGHVLTLHSTYPHANLGRLVRNLVASKQRQFGVAAAEELRADLLRQPSAQSRGVGAPQWLRGFALVNEQATDRIASAGVFHAELSLSRAAPVQADTPLRLVARVRFGGAHLASKARELGATLPAAQIFAGIVLRRLSFDCKDVFMAERRTVALEIAVDFGEACPAELRTALSQGLVSESWRIAGWRAAPLSL